MLYKEEIRDFHQIIDKISFEHDQAHNSLQQLENYVEKYQPLRIQQQITETLAYCLDRRAKARLADYDRRESNKLRKTIMSDIGNPRLKKEVLDLIQKLQDGTLLKKNNHHKESSATDEHAIASSSSSESDLEEEHDDEEPTSHTKKDAGSSTKKSKGVKEAEEESIQQRINKMHEIRDRIMEQSQTSILEAEAKMMQRVMREQDRVTEMFNEFTSKLSKRLDEMQGFENALKDEQDRIEDRIKQSANELFAFQSMMVGTFKKVQGDLYICGDDTYALAQIVRSIIDHCHHMLTCAEAQHNAGGFNESGINPLKMTST